MASNKERKPPSLPEHLIFYEIFPRLPAKSIHRILCVSTSCRRLTSDHQFHSAVRRISGRRYHLSFAADHSELAVYTVDQSCTALAGETPRKNPVHASTVNGLTFTVQAGDFSTIRAIDGHKSRVQGPYIATISNADTNETFQLPPVPVLNSIKDKMRFYLCHDPESKTERYKVLRTAVPYESEENDPVKTKCSIFTLGTKMMTSSWRDFDLLRLKQSGDSKSVCINGTLYLTRFCDDNNIPLIGAFVVEMEKFYPVSYPARLPPSRYDRCHLIELKGSLAVIDLRNETFITEMKLWIKEKGMFEFGVDAWTELRIDIDPRWEMNFRLLKSCSFSTNYDGEIMLGITGINTRERCWIFTYDVEKGEWRRVEIQGLPEGLSITGDLRVEENLRNIFSLKQTLNPSKRQCLG